MALSFNYKELLEQMYPAQHATIKGLNYLYKQAYPPQYATAIEGKSKFIDLVNANFRDAEEELEKRAKERALMAAHPEWGEECL